MSVYEEKEYLEFEERVDGCRESKSNILVVSVAGFGLSEFGRTYVERRKNNGVKMLTDLEGDVGDFNLLNFRFSDDVDALNKVDKIVLKSGPLKKFCVLLNQPGLLNSDLYQKSYIKNHIYVQHYVKALNFDDSSEMILRLNGKLTTDKVRQIYKQSGGIASLIKVLTVGGDENIINNYCKSIVHSIFGCNEDLLELIGLKKNGKFISEILLSLPIDKSFSIEITPDLKIFENGKFSGKLNIVEKKILEEMIKNPDQFINNEKISDIKWGEGKYEKFSDQAINKAMHRIGAKLKKHKITTVWKTGYKLENL